MKSISAKICFAITCAALAGVFSTQAQPIVSGHYPAGAEGIKGSVAAAAQL